jgi:starvation-inducible DNA-binding protein
MASPATSTHVPALAQPHAREAVAHELEATLRELVELALVGKQLHWAVIGPMFRPLHLHLDELVDGWRELADTVAERAVALGYVPDGQARAVAASAQLPALSAEALDDHEVVSQMTPRISHVSERTRERMDRLGDLDAVSQDVVIDVVRALEEHEWMLRAQLGGHGS